MVWLTVLYKNAPNYYMYITIVKSAKELEV